MCSETPGTLALMLVEFSRDVNAVVECSGAAQFLPRLTTVVERVHALVDGECQRHDPGTVLATIATEEARRVHENVQWLENQIDHADHREIAGHLVLAVSRARTVVEILLRLEEQRITGPESDAHSV